MTEASLPPQDRPLVTFALFAYNQEKYIREAVEGAFAQTYEPLEIILSDDCSSDRTFEIMQQMAAEYEGPHDIIVNRNAKNLGIGAHVNKMMVVSKGRYVIGAAGDDISTPERTSVNVEVFLSHPDQILSVWSSARYIDGASKLIYRVFRRPIRRVITERSMVRNKEPVIGATHAWDRKIFDLFGPLREDVMFEDNALSFRSYLVGDIIYVHKELVFYRSHADNITNFTRKSDIYEFFRSAARRSYWALNGIDQRLTDLEVACGITSRLHRNFGLLKSELIEMKEVMARRHKAYVGFPDVEWGDLRYCATDTELLKALTRSMVFKLRRILSPE